MGRYDGFHAAYSFNKKVTVNAVGGFPIESFRDSGLNTEKRFGGTSVDLKNIYKNTDLTLYTIYQTNKGLIDREAVGSEVRYFTQKYSFYNVLDYDTKYNSLNLFMLNGWWNFDENTTLNFSTDYGNAPFLTTTNAIIGQGVEHLYELFDRLS